MKGEGRVDKGAKGKGKKEDKDKDKGKLVGGLEHFLFFHNIWDNPSH